MRRFIGRPLKLSLLLMTVCIGIYLVSCGRNHAIQKEWDEKQALIDKYGIEFFRQNNIVEVLREQNGNYEFSTRNGELIVLTSNGATFDIDIRGQRRTYPISELGIRTDLSNSLFVYWVSALTQLNAFLITKNEVPGCEAVHISDYTVPPFFDTPARGWFFIPADVANKQYCVDYFQQYFSYLVPLSDSWFYGERNH